MYDASLGRFHTIDPFTEKYSFQSHYLYAFNNPTRFIDYLGMNGEDGVKYDNENKTATVTHTTEPKYSGNSYEDPEYNSDGSFTQVRYEEYESTKTETVVDEKGDVTETTVTKTTTYEGTKIYYEPGGLGNFVKSPVSKNPKIETTTYKGADSQAEAIANKAEGTTSVQADIRLKTFNTASSDSKPSTQFAKGVTFFNIATSKDGNITTSGSPINYWGDKSKYQIAKAGMEKLIEKEDSLIIQLNNK